MKSTLSQRIKDAMAGPPKISGKALADACGISPASVSDWRNGETHTIEGKNLVRAADFLNVRAKWLAEGTGSMRESNNVHTVREPTVAYRVQSKTDKQTTELLSLFGQLDKAGKNDCLSFLRVFVASRINYVKDPPGEHPQPANFEKTGTHH
jgi:transcriptional regulator with XRE-family HTH domain